MRFLPHLLTLLMLGTFSPCHALNGIAGDLKSFSNYKVYELNTLYDAGIKEFEEGNWEKVIETFTLVRTHFGKDPKADEALYFLGIASLKLGDAEAGEKYLSRYLKKSQQPKYLEEVQYGRLEIAKLYRKGSRLHLFGWKFMPKWLSGKTEAVRILDEISLTMPYTDLAAKSFYELGKLLVTLKDYKGASESFTTVAKRFPDSELAIKSYMKISDLYLEQSEKEYQNPDLLQLAEINLVRFKTAYPGDGALAKAEENIEQMKENYSQGLYDTGQFYERKDKPKASAIYYLQSLGKFPTTNAAKLSKGRLILLQSRSDEIQTMVVQTGIDLENSV